MKSRSFLSLKSGSPSAQGMNRPVSARREVLPPQVPGVVKENRLRKQSGQSGWFISLGLHGIVLLCLAGITIDPLIIHAPAIQIEQPISEPEPEFVFEPEELEVSDVDLKELGALSERGVTVAEAISSTKADIPFIPPPQNMLVPKSVRIEPVTFESMGPNEVDQLIETVVGVNVGVAATGASGAIDRLSLEIARSLEDAPTTVCWVFDQSVSLAGQRQEIASRLKRVFRELSHDSQGDAPAGLTNLVLAYGQRFKFIVNKPTRVSSEVVEAIQGIEVDNSGVEKTFTAIRAAAERLSVTRRVGRSNGMIIVFTDEVGDDQSLADQVATICRRLGVSVCVVGVPAPFGQRFIEMKYVEFDPTYASVEDWAVVEQGPETLFPEAIQISENSLSNEAIDSGFGPFSLSKLCYQTGGVYIAVHANRNLRGRVPDRATAPMSSRIRYFFDQELLRDYQPDYVSATKLRQKVASNAAKQSLVTAAAATNLRPMVSPETVFPKKSEGELANLLSLAQRSAAVLQPRVDAIYSQLLRGLPDRERIEEERWKAGFDLAMGRILAMKVRTDAYNLMLARAKSGMQFQRPKSDTWVLRPSDVVNVGSRTEKYADQAREYLRKVVEDHPGTPWAFLAKRELGQPLGYAWDEIHTGINDPPKPRPPGNNNTPMPRDDKPRSLGPPMPKRNLKRI
ncbi:MAG: VWA domain-containing protein [Phycisphaeraceae bacterium]|nr:MAG: VWA domain-containing protein [Phycisphaeraceae bacterium]